MAAGVYYRAGEMENFWGVRADCRGIDDDSRAGAELGGAATGRQASTAERRGHHDFAAILGLGVGRNGIDISDSHHGGLASDLRSYGIVAADWALVERLSKRLLTTDQRNASLKRSEPANQKCQMPLPFESQTRFEKM